MTVNNGSNTQNVERKWKKNTLQHFATFKLLTLCVDIHKYFLFGSKKMLLCFLMAFHLHLSPVWIAFMFLIKMWYTLASTSHNKGLPLRLIMNWQNARRSAKILLYGGWMGKLKLSAPTVENYVAILSALCRRGIKKWDRVELFYIRMY